MLRLNSVNLVGNISTDIALKYTPQGTAIARFNLAVTNPYNREKTSFIPIECWRQTAENTSNFCGKGSKIGVVGIIEVENYEKDGQKKTFTKIVANSIEFLNSKNDNNSSGNTRGNTNTRQSQNNVNTEQQRGNTPIDDDPFSGQFEISDSDLPF